MRLDVFQAKVAAEKNIKDTGEWDKLSPEDQRLVEKMILDGKRAGLALSEAERDELMTLKKELSQVCLDFTVSLSDNS
jgi:Zn-dependent oligopeptidase